MKKLFSFFRVALLFVGFSQANSLCAQEPTVNAVLIAPVTVKAQMEINIFNAINRVRANYGLRLLAWSPVASELARSHSVNMANGLVPFGHQGAELRFQALRTAIPSTTHFGENVAYNRGVRSPAQRAVLGWLNSPAHLSNIIGDYNYTGVGVVSNSLGQYYFTQIFFKARSQFTALAENTNRPIVAEPPVEPSEYISQDPPAGWEGNQEEAIVPSIVEEQPDENTDYLDDLNNTLPVK